MASAMTVLPDLNENLQRSQRSDGPEPAAIARDRSLQKTKGKYNRRGTSDTKNVSLHDRITQFPDQYLIVRGTKIFCDACKEIVSSKKSVLKSHCTSQKHTRSKEKLKKSKLKEQTIAEAASSPVVPGEFGCDVTRQACRLLYSTLLVILASPEGMPRSLGILVRGCLKLGDTKITATKVRLGRLAINGKSKSNMAEAVQRLNFSQLLEELKNASEFGWDSFIHVCQQTREVIGDFLFKQEVERIKKELSLPGQADMTRDVSVIFDGSTRQGEAIAIIVGFIDDEWVITQRLIRIDVCSKSVNADELARVLNEALCLEFGTAINISTLAAYSLE
ncbi:hypothetical protein ACROYT_G018679 [Oculina patagonica]